MTLRLGWFTTARGPGSRGMFEAVIEAHASGQLPSVEFAFVFCNRDRGEDPVTDALLDRVETLSIPLVTRSSVRFRKRVGGPRSRSGASFSRPCCSPRSCTPGTWRCWCRSSSSPGAWRGWPSQQRSTWPTCPSMRGPSRERGRWIRAPSAPCTSSCWACGSPSGCSRAPRPGDPNCANVDARARFPVNLPLILRPPLSRPSQDHA